MARSSDYPSHGPPPTASPTSPTSHQLHKTMTIRGDRKGDSPNLRHLYRTSADMSNAVDQDSSQQSPISNGVPKTPTLAPNLPPTPPVASNEDQTSVPGGDSSETTQFRSTPVTPVNQNSPPTPDNTPPRDRILPVPRHFLGTQPSMASTRAESFKTAQEELTSDGESDSLGSFGPSMDDQTSRVRKLPVALPNGVRRVQANAVGPSPLVSNTILPFSTTESTISDGLAVTPRQNGPLVIDDSIRDEQGMAMQTPVNNKSNSPMSQEASIVTPRLVNTNLPSMTTNLSVEPQSVNEPVSINQNYKDNVRRGPSLRDRLKEAQKSSASASTEKFANIIGWNDSISPNHTLEEQRYSGFSYASTIGALVTDSTPLPKKRNTLRHVSKNDSLRSASSPLPAPVSARDSLNSNSESPHRLIHKKARLSNQNRWSFGSEASRSYSVSSSAVAPKIEVIRVTVIPETPNVPSENGTKSHSRSTTSRAGGPPTLADAMPSTSSRRKRTKSEPQSQLQLQLLDEDTQPELVLPLQKPPLSLPTSRSTSRANSTTSEHLRVRRLEAESDLRKTLDKMESDRLLTNLHSDKPESPFLPLQGTHEHKATEIHRTRAALRGSNDAFRTPRQSFSSPRDDTSQGKRSSIVPGSHEWAALRPASTLETPFSQPSFRTTSPELNEARAINFFPHNNHSLQIIEPNMMPESRAVNEVRRQHIDRGEAIADSPLRYPRHPPQPPRFDYTGSQDNQEVDVHPIQPIQSTSRWQPATRRQTESFMKTISRNLSLKNAKNRKADQSLDGNLHPFWRPKAFWDDLENESGNKNLAVQQTRNSESTGIVSNSLGLPQERTVITGPLSLVRRLSERRRQNRALTKQSSANSLSRIRATQRFYRTPILGSNFRFLRIHGVQDRLLYARQRKEDERRERRRAALRETIGANIIPQGDSRFPASDLSLVRV